MAGPLTPPPTTAIEMADEARTPAPIVTEPTPAVSAPAPVPAPVSAPAPPPKQIVQDSYQVLFPTLANLAHQTDYTQLISAAEYGDLKADEDRQLTRLLLIAPLVLSYLVVDDLPPAKHALNRLPEKLTAHPLTQALYGLVAATWEKHYEHIYSRVEALFRQAQQPDFLDAKLGEIVALLVKAFESNFQKRTVALLSRAFVALPMTTAQKYLGLPPDQLLAAVGTFGWSYDASSATLTLPAATATTIAPAYAKGPSSLHSFNLVADSTAKLEM